MTYVADCYNVIYHYDELSEMLWWIHNYMFVAWSLLPFDIDLGF